jgi:hypothetical protein
MSESGGMSVNCLTAGGQTVETDVKGNITTLCDSPASIGSQKCKCTIPSSRLDSSEYQCIPSYLGYRNDKPFCVVSEQLEQTANSAFLFSIYVHLCIGAFYNL